MKKRRNISRRNLRKIIINENINLYQNKINDEGKKFKARVKMLRKINQANINESKMIINEFGLGDIMSGAEGMVSKFLGAGSDTLKSFIVGKVIGMFGVSEGTEAYDIVTNAFEQIELSEITGLFSGETKLEDIAESLIKGLIEYMVEKGIGEVFEKVKEIPMLKSIIPDQESLMGKINTEALSSEVADAVTPQLMPLLQDVVSKISGGMLGGKDSTPAELEAATAMLSEIYAGAASHSRQKLLSYNRKLNILKLAQKEI